MTPKSQFNSGGFSTISLLLFLPIFCSLIFASGFIGYFIQHKTIFRSTCLTEGKKIQENLIRNEESIFKLNSLARALRLQLRLAYAELALATAANNHPGMINAQAKIFEIQSQQKKLDLLQKNLIQKAKFEMISKTMSLHFKLNLTNANMSAIWKAYLEIYSNTKLEQMPELALVPDSPDLAPVYELSTDYIEKQTLALSWQNSFKPKPSGQKILDSQSESDFICRVGAKKEGSQWNLLINVGKY